MAATLAESAVLAAAKETLDPDLNTNSDQYAVTETQFTTPTQGHGRFQTTCVAVSNYTIRLTSGEPDLLGVGMPAVGVLNADTATTPVAVIEAKGHNSNPSKADVHTGINQAHRHLSEVSLGYVAAPLQSITNQVRALARSLNIGIIGVDNTHTGTLVGQLFHIGLLTEGGTDTKVEVLENEWELVITWKLLEEVPKTASGLFPDGVHILLDPSRL